MSHLNVGQVVKNIKPIVCECMLAMYTMEGRKVMQLMGKKSFYLVKNICVDVIDPYSQNLFE